MSDSQKLSTELMQFEAELLEAEQRHDVLALDQLLDASFVLVTTKGNRLPKQDFLAFLEDARMLSFELLNMEVREIGPGLAALDGLGAGAPTGLLPPLDFRHLHCGGHPFWFAVPTSKPCAHVFPP